MDNLSEKGALLKKTRQAQGISLDTVHENTKIPLDALRALEEGYTVRTLSPFYQKGFLKIYAQYLGCDVGDLLSDFKPKEVLDSNARGNYPSTSQKSFLSKEKSHPSSPKTSSPLPLFNLKEIPFSKTASQFFNRDRLILAGKVLGILIFILIFFKATGFVSQKLFSKNKKPVSIKSSAIAQSGKSKKEKIVKENHLFLTKSTTEAQPSGMPASDSLEKEESHKNVLLSVRAQKNTWLQVKVDGSTVFESILKKGVAETWVAQKEIELSGKNINQLEFEVNGKMIGSLGREDSQAKKVVITKNGLSVKE